ncbi:lipase family protein [Flavitalea antarctica]
MTRPSNTGHCITVTLAAWLKMRRVAAQQLADYVMANRKKGESITLVGHSHGGNVAIQASEMIRQLTGEKVNLITIATPAYNKSGDSENPGSHEKDINQHIALWNRLDAVSGGLAGEDNYTNSDITTNIEIDVDFWYIKKEYYDVSSGHGEYRTKESTVVDSYGAHSFDVHHPESLIQAIRRMSGRFDKK